MNDISLPWQLLFVILSGWVHRRQQQIIEFQNSQIISLMQNQWKKRVLLTNDVCWPSKAKPLAAKHCGS